MKPDLRKWLRHAPTCKAGKHCEDPFCHYSGNCTCGLDKAMEAAEMGGRLDEIAEENGKPDLGPLYYIQDIRQVVGNCALWWCPNSAGYTTQIDEAGLYTEEQIKKLHRKTDVPWPKEEIDAIVVRHVRVDQMQRRDKK